MKQQTRGTADLFQTEEGRGNNRSVMPLDVPGCTRATMIVAVSILIKFFLEVCASSRGVLTFRINHTCFESKRVINSKLRFSFAQQTSCVLGTTFLFFFFLSGLLASG